MGAARDYDRVPADQPTPGRSTMTPPRVPIRGCAGCAAPPEFRAAVVLCDIEVCPAEIDATLGSTRHGAQAGVLGHDQALCAITSPPGRRRK